METIKDQELAHEMRNSAQGGMYRMRDQFKYESFPCGEGRYVRFTSQPEVVFYTDINMKTILSLPTVGEWNACKEGILVGSSCDPELFTDLWSALEVFIRDEMRADVQALIEKHVTQGGDPEAFLTLYKGEYQVRYRGHDEDNTKAIVHLDLIDDRGQSHNTDSWTFTAQIPA